MWGATVLTLFPEMFPGPLGFSLAGKALHRLWSLDTKNIRDFATDKHQSVDEICYGGGPGMVLRPDVIASSIDWAQRQHPEARTICLTPRGRPLTQKMVREYASTPHLILLCGRYEGIDERIFMHYSLDEVSVGDYILSGGELAAMAFLDACVRLIPGVMGDMASADDESFQGPLLEYPHYTRPRVWNGIKVPDVLCEGHHSNIKAWRLEKAKELTRDRRPDLWSLYQQMDKD